MINVVGVGLDGAYSLTPQVLKIVENSTILIGGDRHLSYFPNYQGIKLKIHNLSNLMEEIKGYQEKNKKIVFLATGDPLFFGIGRFLLEKFKADDLRFFPHFSCVQLAFNSLKIPYQDAKLISIHGREIDHLIKAIKIGTKKIAVLTDYENNSYEIINLYQQLKIPHKYDFWLCENLGGNNQKVSQINLDGEYDLKNIASLNILILIKKETSKSPLNVDELPLMGIDDSLFLSFEDRPGLMTKKEIRLMILGALSLQKNQVIWDIGAGTGSVAIEIARLTPDSQIYAIEKSAIALTLIEKNCQRFKVNNINIVGGLASKTISQLPSPDRVFMGGSGGELENILNIINDKINEKGQIAIALATLENLGEALNWFKKNQWQYQILQTQISRSLSIANMTRFNPLNPVYIISASKSQKQNQT